MSNHPVSERCLAVMKDSATPCGLYARQKWLGEDRNPTWQADFDRTVKALRHGQGSDGLWDNSPLATIRRLFGLHLTARSSDPDIDRALDALLAHVQVRTSSAENIHYAGEDLLGLPFAPCRGLDVTLPAIMFLGSLFGRASWPSTRALYDDSLRRLSPSSLATASPCWIHNCFRALVVHPEYASDAVTQRIVAWYAQRQTDRGDWGLDIPFYQALNAMAHLHSAAASQQCAAAVAALTRRQNPDGSWGRQQREWQTFLTLHALFNMGKLARTLESGRRL